MGSKSKKSGKRASSNDLIERVRRALEKRQFKQAVKDARVCYRRVASDDHRLILQQALASRADGLCRGDTIPQARALLDELLSLQPIDPDIQVQLPDLMLRAGLMDRHKAMKVDDLSEAERERLRIKAADLAVLRPQDAPASMPDIIHGGIQIRAALEALEQSEDDRALELIRGIGRKSPFADWRFFVRGLAAFYRGEFEEMLANWGRLDPERMAHRVADKVRMLTEPNGRMPSRDRGMLPVGLIAETQSLQALGSIRELQRRSIEQQWDKLVSGLRTLGSALREFDESLYRRAANVVLAAAVTKGQVELVDRLTGCIEAPPLDPRWNRTRALAAERDEESNSRAPEVRLWTSYRDDVDGLDTISEDERRMIKALVHHRVGSMAVDDAIDAYDEFEDYDELDEPWAQQIVKEFRDAAVNAFEKAQTLCPTFREAYEDLATAYKKWCQESMAAATYRKLLNEVPDDVDALLWLGKYETDTGDDPVAAAGYFERAHTARPLDADVACQFANAQNEVAWHCSQRGEWEAGRAALDRALSLLAPDDLLERARLLAVCTTFERCAGADTAAESRETQLRGLFSGEGPAMLLLSAAASQYGARELESLSDKELKTALQTRVNGTTAGFLAAAMHHLLKGRTAFEWRRQHLDLVLQYLQRTQRVRYDVPDFRRILEFLSGSEWRTRTDINSRQLDVVTSLRLKLVNKARKKFPEEPYFHCCYGWSKLDRGAGWRNGKAARRAFREALRLLQNRNSEEDVKLRTAAQNGLKRLDGNDSASRPFPESEFRMPPEFEDFKRKMDEVMAKCRDYCQQYADSGTKLPPSVIEELRREMDAIIEEGRRCGLEMPEV